MKNIKSKDTSIELKLRKELWHRGYHYRKNYDFLDESANVKYNISIKFLFS